MLIMLSCCWLSAVSSFQRAQLVVTDRRTSLWRSAASPSVLLRFRTIKQIFLRSYQYHGWKMLGGRGVLHKLVLLPANSSTQIMSSRPHTDKLNRHQEFRLDDLAENSRACLTTICSAGATLTSDDLWPERITRSSRRSVALAAAAFPILHPTRALSSTDAHCLQRLPPMLSQVDS